MGRHSREGNSLGTSADNNDCAQGKLLVTFFRPRYRGRLTSIATGSQVLRLFLRGLEIKYSTTRVESAGFVLSQMGPELALHFVQEALFSGRQTDDKVFDGQEAA